MSNAVATAIYSKVTGSINTFDTAIGGRIYYQQAPQEATYPFCVFFLIDERYDYMFLEEFEEHVIQFNIYSNDTASSDEAGDIYGYLTTLFDWCTLTVSGFIHLKMEREFAVLDKLEDDDVWQYAVQYRLLIRE